VAANHPGQAAPDQRLAALRGRKAVVLGLGISNLAVIDCLLRAGARVTAADRKTAAELGETHARLASIPVRLVLGPGYLSSLAGQEIAFLTPGMRRDFPELEQARRAGVQFSSETRLFFELCPAPIVAVTGSAGKTTTTTLVGLMLAETRPGVLVGGNIGKPLVALAPDMGPEDLAVLELSSFQLQDLEMSPHIAAVLNVSPNHLDMHPSMEAYVDAKRAIYQGQGAGDHCVFNHDNEYTRGMARDYDERIRRGLGGHRPVLYSRIQEIGDGAFLRHGQVLLRLAGHGEGLPDASICERGEIKLVGEHNLENVLAASAVAGLAGASPGAMRKVATSFQGVEHRLEPVRVVGRVSYYNDSIATAPDRTIAALRSLPGPMVIILGGYDKKIGFEELARELLGCAKVRAAVVLGATGDKIEAAIDAETARRQARGEDQSAVQVVRVRGGLRDAVETARALAVPGDVVVLSPACASFDMFRNFEERGREFKRLVAEMPEGRGR
jgi:UDP-N-acetylmuramoylalanine--D-glutamate ligase